MLQHLQQERARDGVESTCDVNLDESSRFLLGVQQLAYQLYRHEVVMNTSPLDERALIALYQIIQNTGESVGQALGHQFAKAMYEAYGPVVFDFLWLALLL
jgi:hypothetical protein